MAKVCVISRSGKVIDTVDRKLKKTKWGAKRLDEVSYKGKKYKASWHPTGKAHSKHLASDRYFIYPQGK